MNPTIVKPILLALIIVLAIVIIGTGIAMVFVLKKRVDMAKRSNNDPSIETEASKEEKSCEELEALDEKNIEAEEIK